ncbi:MAG TPA: hypothetical protein VES42_05020 [Pilimelia sp.]|nr:hypothetical protein [Pilimelia sp.]
MIDRTASIYDLLGYEEEAGSAEGRRGRLRAYLKALLLTAATTVTVVFVLRLADIVISPVLVAAGTLALIGLRAAVRRVSPPRRASRSARAVGSDHLDGSYRWPEPDTLRRAVLRWEHRLTRHLDAPGTVSPLEPALREVADERLRQRHGVTLDGDPARARELLGEPLWAVLTGGRRRAGVRELTAALARLEELEEGEART